MSGERERRGEREKAREREREPYINLNSGLDTQNCHFCYLFT